MENTSQRGSAGVSLDQSIASEHRLSTRGRGTDSASFKQQIAGLDLENGSSQDLQHYQPLGASEVVPSNFDPPMSFYRRHRLLHENYNSHPDPQHLSAKQLNQIARQVGLGMEEVLSWFEDEAIRRSELQETCTSALQMSRPTPENTSVSDPGFANSLGTILYSGALVKDVKASSQSLDQPPAWSPPTSPTTTVDDSHRTPEPAGHGRAAVIQSPSSPSPEAKPRYNRSPFLICGFCPPSPSLAERTYTSVGFKNHLISDHDAKGTPVARMFRRTPGICSICSVRFANARKLYKHLSGCIVECASEESRLATMEAARLVEVDLRATHPEFHIIPVDQ